MSSHHIIRDDQEPALLVLHLDNHLALNMLQLLGWAPKIFVAESALGPFLAAAHKLDVALVSKRTVSFWAEELNYQQPMKVVGAEDPLVECLKMLVSEGHYAVNIMTSESNVSGIINAILPFLSKLKVGLLSGQKRHTLLSSGKFSKWVPAGTRMEITPLEKTALISTSGFESNLQKKILKEPMLLMKVSEGQLEVKSESGPFMVSEPIDQSS